MFVLSFVKDNVCTISHAGSDAEIENSAHKID